MSRRGASSSSLKQQQQQLQPHQQQQLQHQPPQHRQQQNKDFSDSEEDELVLKGAKTTDIQEEYTVQSVFGSGGFSTVYTAVDNKNGDVVAIKHIVKFREEPDRMMPWELHKQYLANEVETLLRVTGCPNVVQLYDIYEDAGNIFMVFELIDGEELFDMICANGYYPEPDAKLILRAVCRGLRACHDRNVMHRDIKPENIMCPISDKNSHDLGKATIIDFGLAAILEPGTFATEASGSPGYVAPEILVGCPYDKSVDMWSLGVTAYILLAGYPPWVEDAEIAVEDQIIAGDYEFHSPEWDDVSDLAKDWIKKLLVLDPTKRLNVAEALQHPFLKISPETEAAMKPRASKSTAADGGEVETKMKPDSKTPASTPASTITAPTTSPVKPSEPPKPYSLPTKAKTELPPHTTHELPPGTDTGVPAPVVPESPKETDEEEEYITVDFTLPLPKVQATQEPIVVNIPSTSSGLIESLPTPKATLIEIDLEQQNAAPASRGGLPTTAPTATTAPPAKISSGGEAPPATIKTTVPATTHPLTTTTTPPSVSKPTCSKCGNVSAYTSAKYCKCGHKFEQPATITAPKPTTVPPTTTAPHPPPQPKAHPTAQPPAPTRQPLNRRYVPPDHINDIPVNKQVPKSNIMNRYVPPDHTRNIPVLREVYDPDTKTGKTVNQVVAESYSLNQKVKFPKRGQGKPLRGAKLQDQAGAAEGGADHSAPSTPVPELPKYRPMNLPTYVPPDHISHVPVIREVVKETRLPSYVPPDHISHVPVIREVVKETRLPKYVPPDHISHVPVVKEVADLDKSGGSSTTTTVSSTSTHTTTHHHN